MDRYRNCAVKIGNTTIGQIVELAIEDQSGLFYPADSGSAWNRAVSIDSSVKRIVFTTQALSTALAAIPYTGQALTESAGVSVYMSKFTPNGAISATGGVSFSADNGIAVLRSINASVGQIATATFEVTPASTDGVTDPVTKAPNVAMPAIATTEMWVLEGSDGEHGEQSFTLNTGHQVITDRGGSAVFPTLVYIEAPSQASATLVQRNMGAFGPTSTIESVSLLSAAANGYRGESSISFTFNESMEAVSDISPDTTYQIYPVYDGSNAPVVIGLPG